jgi:hypothetical protein
MAARPLRLTSVIVSAPARRLRAPREAHLTADAAGCLRGSFGSDGDRRAMFSATAELTCLVGWKRAIPPPHGVAQRALPEALVAQSAGGQWGPR